MKVYTVLGFTTLALTFQTMDRIISASFRISECDSIPQPYPNSFTAR